MDTVLDLPHADAVAAVRAAPIAWVLMNPVEYHGPHLPLHTDQLLSTGWIAALHRALGHPGEPVIGAVVALGVEPTVGPGTRAASFAEVRRAAIGACASLAELGATAIGVVTFHGAPLHNLALAAAVSWCRARGIRAVAPFQEVIRELGRSELPLFDAVAHELAPEHRAGIRASLVHDFHAGLLETSLMLHWWPAQVSAIHRTLPPCPPVTPWRPLALAARLARGRLGDELRVAAHGAGWIRTTPFPGYTGSPALATPAIGARFAEAVVDGVLPVVRAALAGEATPAPPFRWVGPASLWGAVRP
ncbi:MAG: creatininase family protein [Myxococcota bacterium]